MSVRMGNQHLPFELGKQDCSGGGYFCVDNLRFSKRKRLLRRKKKNAGVVF